MFKYETHVHSSEGSACGKSTARELVHAYHEAGYTGFVLTNHFTRGNTNVPKDLDWNSRMKMYYDAYLDAKDEGDKLNFDVLFGIEQGYGKGKEVLIYGIDLEFLLKHPELDHADVDTLAALVHDIGGLVVHAHPHRIRDYITPDIPPRYDVCDGIEVYNAHDLLEINDLAKQDAVCLNKIMTSGGDIHDTWSDKLGKAGIVFDKRIRTNQELVQALKNNSGKIIVDGKPEK